MKDRIVLALFIVGCICGAIGVGAGLVNLYLVVTR